MLLSSGLGPRWLCSLSGFCWFVVACGGGEPTGVGTARSGSGRESEGAMSSSGVRAGNAGSGDDATSEAVPGSSGGATGGGSVADDQGNPGEAPPSSLPLEPVPDDGEQTWVFDPAVVHTYELSLDPQVWADLQLNARDEEYAEADLIAAGRSVGRIGLRFKGSLGTLASCFEDDGTPRCDKLSMKLKFDAYDSEQRFLGLKRLNFNSMLFDDTLMHERLAYRVYREMGIAAPRSAHARLIINGEDWGVFSVVEDVDGRFTDNHFDGGDGNLYKEAWPGNVDDGTLAAALETNEDAADHSGILQFQDELLSASPDELPSVLERHLDVDATLAYLAVDESITNWDGFTAFYCYDEYCENHNYFWYQSELESRFTLIPWDLDNTFETSPLTGVPGTFDVEPDCSVIYEAMGRRLRAPGCDPLLRGLIASGGERYAAQLDRLLDGPFAPGVMSGWVDELEALLLPEVMTDARGPDLSTFEGAVGRLRDSVERLRERAAQDRAAR